MKPPRKEQKPHQIEKGAQIMQKNNIQVIVRVRPFNKNENSKAIIQSCELRYQILRSERKQDQIC